MLTIPFFPCACIFTKKLFGYDSWFNWLRLQRSFRCWYRRYCTAWQLWWGALCTARQSSKTVCLTRRSRCVLEGSLSHSCLPWGAARASWRCSMSWEVCACPRRTTDRELSIHQWTPRTLSRNAQQFRGHLCSWDRQWSTWKLQPQSFARRRF